MEVSIEEKGGVPVLKVTGEVDLEHSSTLRKILLDEIQKNSVKAIVDLEAVTYIDSSGLATLVEGLQELNQAGGKLFITGMNDNIRDVFELAHLDEIFDIRDSIESAVKD